ncbi:MAG: STAS domain-containing protein [Candidatus Delongbacteria bacterium]|nr:STAS domain-containing protein [Candidatus Delongbacteria bacterium]
MKVDLTATQDAMILRIDGEIEIREAEELKSYFSQLAVKATGRIILDFDLVTFIGSSGIGKLLSLYKNVNSRGIPIEIINLNENLYNLFLSFKLDKHFVLGKR